MIEALLDRAIAVRGVNAAALVSADGGIMRNAPGAAAPFAAELITTGLASSRVLAGILGDGEVGQAMIEYDDGPILLLPLGKEDDPLLVASLSSASALGLARLQLRKLVPAFAEALASEPS